MSSFFIRIEKCSFLSGGQVMATILSILEVGEVQYVNVHSKLKATCSLTFYKVSFLSALVFAPQFCITPSWCDSRLWWNPVVGSKASLIHFINMEMLNCILSCIRPLLHFLQNTADWWPESFKGWYYALECFLMLTNLYPVVKSFQPETRHLS